MPEIFTIIDGDDLGTLLEHVVNTHNHEGIYKISIIDRANGVAIKINEDIWSPTIGHKEATQPSALDYPPGYVRQIDKMAARWTD